MPSSVCCHLTDKSPEEGEGGRGGGEPEPHHHVKCSQIVFVVFFLLWGEAGGQDGAATQGLLISARHAALMVLHMALH